MGVSVLPVCCGCDGRAGDAVGVEMIPDVLKVSSLAGGTDGVLRPAQEHRDLSDVQWSGAVLEHLWNKTVAHGWGSLAILMLLGW